MAGLGVSMEISPNDEMFAGDIEHYMSVGNSAVRIIDNALAVSQKRRVAKVLDLPCGHGRVLRALVARYPGAAVTACDISRDGVDFCVRTFGVEGVYSSTSTGEIPIEGRFDLIWSGSLLTHLNERRAEAFLSFFADRLENDGILLVSFHGRFSVRRQLTGEFKYLRDALFFEALQGYFERGYGYASYEGQSGLGFSLTRPSWATAWVEGREDLKLLGYVEQGWDNHQDVLIVQKGSVGWRTPKAW
jgi:SAM-dependent methyltransferase